MAIQKTTVQINNELSGSGFANTPFTYTSWWSSNDTTAAAAVSRAISTDMIIGHQTGLTTALTITFQPAIANTSVIQSFTIPLDITVLTGSPEFVVYLRREAAHVQPTLLSNGSPYTGDAVWPDLATIPKLSFVPTTTGTHVIDIAPLVADLFDKTAWTSGDRLSVCIMPTTLSGTDQITIAPEQYIAATATYTAYSRDHQFQKLKDIVAFNFLPADATDRTDTDAFRMVQERKDSRMTYDRRDSVIDPISGLTDPLVFTLSFNEPNNTIIMDAVGGGGFFSEIHPSAGGPYTYITEQWGGATEHTGTDVFRWDPVTTSIGQFRSVIYDSTSPVASAVWLAWDFASIFGTLLYLYVNTANTLRVQVRAVGSVVVPISTADVALSSAIVTGDVLEQAVFWDHTTATAYVQLRVKRAATGQYETYETSVTPTTVTAPPTDPDDPIYAAWNMSGHAYQDFETHGSLAFITARSDLHWDDVKAASNWTQSQWQSDFKVLPYQWFIPTLTTPYDNLVAIKGDPVTTGTYDWGTSHWSCADSVTITGAPSTIDVSDPSDPVGTWPSTDRTYLVRAVASNAEGNSTPAYFTVQVGEGSTLSTGVTKGIIGSIIGLTL